jgi:hypothetical protein
MEPSFDPRSGDYAAMLARAGRHRRVRRARTGAALASAAAVAVLFAALPGAGGPASLRVAGNGVTADETPAPEPSGEPTPGPSEGPEPTAGSTGEPQPSEEPAEDPAEDPGESPRPKPSPSSEPAGGRKPSPRPQPSFATRADYVYLADEAPADCRTLNYAQSTPDSRNWCAVYPGEDTFVAGGGETLPFRLCRSRDPLAGDGRLTSTGHWLKVRALAANGEVVWSWHRDDAPPLVPSITVKAGDCVQWAMTWFVPDEPGTYTLNPVFVVDEYKPAEPLEYEIRVTGSA